MAFLFGDYIDLVLKTYEEKRNSNLLSHLLAHPTTSNLRQECLNTYTDRNIKGEREEVNTLRAFFGVPQAGENFRHVIEECPLDKFRPVRSLIKRRTKSPDLVYVELLAWLIDFKPRPLARAQQELGRRNELLVEDNLTSANNEWNRKSNYQEDDLQKNQDLVKMRSEAIEDSNVIISVSKKPITKLELAVVAALILIVLFGGLSFIWQQKTSKQMAVGNINTGCMYWANDHYDTISCNDERKDRLKFPMNKDKMNTFKRILREDTITEKSIGIVHYIRIEGRREYYTASGHHPIYLTRKLWPLSLYMYNKHLRKGQSENKDSVSERNLKTIKKFARDTLL